MTAVLDQQALAHITARSQAEQLRQARRERRRATFTRVQELSAQGWSGASLSQAIRVQGYRGSETAVRNYLMALREAIGPRRRPRRYYPAISKEGQRHQRAGLSSRRATWLVLRKPEDRSAEDQHLLDLVEQAHPQVKVACALAQAFVQMIRNRNASALQPWLEEAARSGVSELRTFATGIKRDQAAIQAALTYEWSQGQVEGAPFRRVGDPPHRGERL